VASVAGDGLAPGDEVELRVRSTDVVKRTVDFTVSRP
jgi:hypothetical protein